MTTDLDEFTRSYVEAALWSSMDNADDAGGEPLDASYGVDDIAPATLAEMIADCLAFQEENGPHFDRRKETGRAGISWDSVAGADFWLTRNRHGAGFWDGDWPEPMGTALTEAAHACGSYDLHVGADRLIHGH